MSAPTLRLIVAHARAALPSGLIDTLQSALPPHLSCIAWHPDVKLTPQHDHILLIAADSSNQEDSTRETALRLDLDRQGVSYQVLYSTPDDLLQAVRHALAHKVGRSSCPEGAAWMRPDIPPRWQGLCEACSDAACEHRLFRQWL